MPASATEVEINFSPLAHHYTLEEFWEIPDPEDRSHYELIGGICSWSRRLIPTR